MDAEPGKKTEKCGIRRLSKDDRQTPHFSLRLHIVKQM
jgi:hypothetical protein